MLITSNFNLDEFHSKDGQEVPSHLLGNIFSLASNLQSLRDHYRQPITINSGYRSPEHNKAVGGVPDSTHTRGVASDIVVAGVSPQEVAETIEKLIAQGTMEEGGIGVYDTFVHYDVRGYRARWDYSTKKKSKVDTVANQLMISIGVSLVFAYIFRKRLR